MQAGGTFAPGDAGLGTLTVSNTLNLGSGSTTTLAINRASGSYGSVAGLTSVSFGGTLNVTSLGGTYMVGDSFQLFNIGGIGNFSATNLPVISPLKWNWNPATGNLSVVPAISVNTNAPNVLATVNGNKLSLFWPSDHVGWRLQVQTNNLSHGVSLNQADWGTVSGSSTTNQEVITINPALPAEYYRLVYP